MPESDSSVDPFPIDASPIDDDCTTIDVARRLKLAVRSVQLMVDRGELQAWKTPGGHRRIARSSVDRWLATRGTVPAIEAAAPMPMRQGATGRKPRKAALRVLLIEDSRHYQNLVKVLLAETYPDLELHVADNGIAGLALAGQIRPALLVVELVLPGIDGATLITTLRTHPQFRPSRLIVITSLNEAERVPYAFALTGVPVVHKADLVTQLPPQVAQCLQRLPGEGSGA